MKTKWLLVVCACFGCFSCSNPVKENTVPGTDLSAQDRADITFIAHHFSQRNIDSIWAGPTVHYGMVAPVTGENDYTGHVTFDSVYTDTDKISYQSLEFYNRYWFAYSAYGLPDSEMVFVINWYSSSVYFHTVEKTVFKIDTLTIIATMSGDLNKTAIVGYLNTIQAIQADTADTNHSKIPADFSLAHVANIYSYMNQDTTVMEMQRGDSFSIYGYWFRFCAGVLIDAGADMVIY
ncbi:MAG: hypothetical protein ABSF80_05590 [Chitinispirillaceae bacterium]